MTNVKLFQLCYEDSAFQLLKLLVWRSAMTVLCLDLETKMLQFWPECLLHALVLVVSELTGHTINRTVRKKLHGFLSSDDQCPLGAQGSLSLHVNCGGRLEFQPSQLRAWNLEVDPHLLGSEINGQMHEFINTN